MKRRISSLTGLLGAVSVLVCSCSGAPAAPGQSEAASAQASVETRLSEYIEQSTEEILEQVERDVYISCACSSYPDWNAERFRKAFAKASNGEEITVAYIGGSITEGYTLLPDQCWAYLTHKQLSEKYPDAKINYVNAGLSGTPSTLGLIRAERDVIAPYGDPDIVFIEFAVNDDGSAVTKEAYESLVRRMLDLDSAPAVALVFMRTKDGYSCQNWQSAVGELYGLPMVSMNDALTKAFEDGYMTWEDYSNDEAHPNPEGSKFVAEAVGHMFDLLEDKGIGSDTGVGEYDFAYDIPPLYGDSFVNMHLTDASTLEPVSAGDFSRNTGVAGFQDAWTRKGGENEPIVFDMDFDDLFIVYHANNNKHFGTAEVYVDGELKTEVVSNRKDGWSNPVPQLVMRGDGTKPHRVEVKMKGDGEKEYFGVLAFGFTD
ncbi:MAG: SGNH/GDSL hydrolase family protein [Ruminiclostridium sp.]|nr:SGNH/GDSL hydrolase family protein [Ruminiclostridium sp.]